MPKLKPRCPNASYQKPPRWFVTGARLAATLQGELEHFSLVNDLTLICSSEKQIPPRAAAPSQACLACLPPGRRQTGNTNALRRGLYSQGFNPRERRVDRLVSKGPFCTCLRVEADWHQDQNTGIIGACVEFFEEMS